MSEKRVSCDCGATITEGSDEALVDKVQKHAKEVHNMDLSRDQIMDMAEVVSADS